MNTDAPTVRLLEDRDQLALNKFLLEHNDTTMFMQSNSARAGITYGGKAFQADYVAAWEDECITGVAAHSWRGGLMLEAPDELLPDLANAVLVASRRPLTGFSGACHQVKLVRDVLGMANTPCFIKSEEILFRLELREMVVPPALLQENVECRLCTEDDLETLIDWQIGYAVEALGRSAEQAREEVQRSQVLEVARDGRFYLLAVNGVPVSRTAFNARTESCVQIGGVWTPPEQRSKGHARSAVAGSLLAARSEGVTHSILFTEQSNHAAQACYRSLGFQVVGDFMLVQFKEPQHCPTGAS